MQGFVQFLKGIFAPSHWPRLPETSPEITMHDALRLCAGRARNDIIPAADRLPKRRIRIFRYRSESELRRQWRRLEYASYQGANITVILACDAFLQDYLRELIRQRHPVIRLTIIPPPGQQRWSNPLRALPLSPASSDRHSVKICQDLNEALTNTFSAFDLDEPLFVVLPARNSSCRTATDKQNPR